jgi:MFS family permease
VSIYSVEGLSGLAGRVAFGLLGDRFGAKRTFICGLLVQAVAAGSYMFTREQYQFYGVAIVFGFAYAGVMPLYAVLVRENFPVQIIGTVVGAATMASSLGMATGPLVGGVLFDTYGTYRWLYISSLLTGLAAAAIMLAFRPSQRPNTIPAAAGSDAVAT